MPMKRVKMWTGKKLYFWKLKVTAGNELAYVTCLTNIISQPNLGISHIWIPHITSELATHREDPYDLTDSSWIYIRFLSWGRASSVFIP
jgi:hypothetical protein